MTAAIRTIERDEPRGGAIRFARRLGAALAAPGHGLVTWSSAYYGKGIGEELEALPPAQRLDAALDWQARHGRVV